GLRPLQARLRPRCRDGAFAQARSHQSRNRAAPRRRDRQHPFGDRGATMTHVNVTIHGRQYRMACEDGQEDHLVRLAKDLDQRIEQLKASFGAIGDMRLIVMAALTVGDELSEAAKRVRRLEEELTALQDSRVASSERAQATQVAVAAALNSASERIESVTRSLNQRRGDGGKIAMG